MPFETKNPAQELRDKARDMFPFNTKLAESTYHWNAADVIDRLTAKIESDAKMIAALREATIGLNEALDRFWEGKKSDAQMTKICEWQQACKKALGVADI
jgi:hypothetical protein